MWLPCVPAEVGCVLVSRGVKVHQEEPELLPGTVQCLREDTSITQNSQWMYM